MTETVAHAALGSREFDRKKWGPKIFPPEVVFALAVQVTASHPHLPPSLVLGVRLCRNVDDFPARGAPTFLHRILRSECEFANDGLGRSLEHRPANGLQSGFEAAEP
jgi:hypothetical protein